MAFRLGRVELPVTDLEKSLAFYKKALGLQVVTKEEDKDASSATLSDGAGAFGLRLVQNKRHKGKYALGENEFHVGFVTADMDKARKLHKAMGCVSYENERMGIYFIEDPDEHWLEVLPVKKAGQADGTHAGFAQNHVNINVADADKAIAFYLQQTNWKIAREVKNENHRITFLTDDRNEYFLELTWLKDHPHKYDLGENPRRIVLCTDNLTDALHQHKRSGAHLTDHAVDGSYGFRDDDGYVTLVEPVVGF